MNSFSCSILFLQKNAYNYQQYNVALILELLPTFDKKAAQDNPPIPLPITIASKSFGTFLILYLSVSISFLL